jgi:gliding motility-associated-like protein
MIDHCKKIVLEKKGNDWMLGDKKAQKDNVDFYINQIKTLKATDIIKTDTINVNVYGWNVLLVPNAFTPNNDMLNNYYKPVGNNGIQYYNMKIYNRWGQKLFEWEGDMTDDQSVGSWDGRFNGVMQQEGVYVVLIRAIPICGAHFTERQTFHMIR